MKEKSNTMGSVPNLHIEIYSNFLLLNNLMTSLFLTIMKINNVQFSLAADISHNLYLFAEIIGRLEIDNYLTKLLHFACIRTRIENSTVDKEEYNR